MILYLLSYVPTFYCLKYKALSTVQFMSLSKEAGHIYCSIWSAILIPNPNSPICPDAHTSRTPHPPIMLIAAYLMLLMANMLAKMMKYLDQLFKQVTCEPEYFPTESRLSVCLKGKFQEGCVCVWSYLLVTGADTGGRWPITAASQITQRSKLPELRMSAGGPGSAAP